MNRQCTPPPPPAHIQSYRLSHACHDAADGQRCADGIPSLHMSPAAPSLLLLDFDGVLASYSRPRRLAALAAAAACTPQRVQQVVFEQGLERAYDAGMIETQDYLAQLSEGLGRVIDRARWIAARVAACRADPSVVAQVVAVSATTAVAMLTNNGPLMVLSPKRNRTPCAAAAA